MSSTTRAGDVLSVSVHGPVGVLDLHVPAAASSADVAREYSRQANLPSVPALYTRLGQPLPDRRLAGRRRRRHRRGAGRDRRRSAARRAARAAPTRRRRGAWCPGALSMLWCLVAVVVAVLAGWLASRLPEASDLRDATIVVLVAAAVRRRAAARAARRATACSPCPPTPAPRPSSWSGTRPPSGSRRSSASPASSPR